MSYAPFPLVWGFFGGSGGASFGVIQTDFGTYPTATSNSDVLSLVSADPTRYFFTGTALTDTVTLSITGFVKVTGDTMTGALIMSDNDITGIQDVQINNSLVLGDPATVTASGTQAVSIGYTTTGGEINSTGSSSFASGACQGAGSEILASGDAAFARAAVQDGATFTVNGEGSTGFGGSFGSGSVVLVSGSVAFASVLVQTGANATASGPGSLLAGWTYGTSAQMIADAAASFVHAIVSDGAVAQATGDGTFIQGTSFSPGSVLEATSTGATVIGSADSGGLIRGAGFAALATGYADTTGTIEASGSSAFARGVAKDSGQLLVTDEGAFGFGYVQGTDSEIRAAATATMVYGSATGGAKLTSYSLGSFVCGLADSTGSFIEANSGVGQFVGGNARGGGSITATNDGTFTWAATDNTGVVENKSQGGTLFGFGFGTDGILRVGVNATPGFLWGYADGGLSEIEGPRSVGFLVSDASAIARVTSGGEGSFAIIAASSGSIGEVTAPHSFLKARLSGGETVTVSGSSSSAFITGDLGSNTTISGNNCFVAGEVLDITHNGNFAFGKGFSSQANDEFIVGFGSVCMHITQDTVSLNKTVSLPPSTSGSTGITLSSGTFWVYSGAGTATWSLPALLGTGYWYRVKNRGGGNLTINVTGGGSVIYTTSAVASIVLAPGDSVDFHDDGTYWEVC